MLKSQILSSWVIYKNLVSSWSEGQLFLLDFQLFHRLPTS